ncbi:MAG: hypothetical protein RL291_424 [Pseudomonadota bacterium]
MTAAHIADLPLTTRLFHIGGSVYRISAAEDQEALLAATASRPLVPFGLMLWESAIVLAEALAEGAALGGQRILELGAGVGLPGIVAARLGADVTAIDIDPLALDVARNNAGQNGCASNYRTLVASWRDVPSLSEFNCVIGADIAYDHDDVGHVARWLDHAMRPGGRALLTDPDRPTGAALVAELKSRGGVVSTKPMTTPDLKTPGRTISVTLIRAAHAPSSGPASGLRSTDGDCP